MRKALVVVLVLLTASSAAYASSITFEFVLPHWTEIGCGPGDCGPSSPGALRFGSYGILDVTVDNAAPNLFAQVYTLDDVTSVQGKTSDGTYNDVFSRAPYDSVPAGACCGAPAFLTSGAVPLIMTSADGTALFLLSTGLEAAGGWGNLSVGSSGIQFADECCDSYADVQATASTLTGYQVPEPATLELLGFTVVGIDACARRQRAHRVRRVRRV
jgi:hypothetical protein